MEKQEIKIKEEKEQKNTEESKKTNSERRVRDKFVTNSLEGLTIS